MRVTLQTVLLAALFTGVFHVSVAQVPARSGGRISGILVGKDGAPLGGVRVTAMAVPDPAAGDAETSVLVSLAQTDSQGRYLLENVPPGRYYITAGFVNLPTYYPGTTVRLSATAVEVRVGEELRGINFPASLPSPIGGAINGRVELSDFPGAQRIHLQGRALSAAIGISSLDTIVKDDGTFAFPQVPPGSYTLRVFGPGNVLFGSVTTTAEVNDRDVDVQVRSPVPFLVGRIVTEDGSPLPPLPNGGDSQTLAVTSQWANAIERTSIQSGGMFVLRRPQAEMKIGMNSLPLGYTIKSISYAGRNLTAGSLKLDGPPFGELLITLEFKRPEDVVGVSVRGKAINIPAELFVRKIPVVRMTFTGGPLLETPLNHDGSFEFQKVPPGTYTFWFMSAAGRLSNPQTIVGNSDIQDVEIDLRNNPFPEFPVGSSAAVFNSNQMMTLHGVMTQGITQIRPPASSYYFRMDADPDGTGRAEHWGIMLFSPTGGVLSDPNMAALKPGARITAVINPDRDGSPRGFLVPQAGANTPIGIVITAP